MGEAYLQGETEIEGKFGMKTPKRDWRKCPLLTAKDRAYLDRAEIGVMFGVERRLIEIIKRLAAAIPQPKRKDVEK